jgi:cyclic pyranopterin phosphate synthase
VATVFAALGVRAVRLTGGEPLLRHELDRLVALIARDRRIDDLSLTTNGILLAPQAAALRRAGLGRVTVSLDTLRPARMEELSRSARLPDVLRGIDAARDAGLGLKINTVVIRGFNDDELGELLAFARDRAAEVRFIEYMDVGGATGWSAAQVLSCRDMLSRIAEEMGQVTELTSRERPAAPARRYRLADGTTFGIVASTTEPFCRACDRARLTADGHLYLCLYAGTGIDLRTPLRSGADDATLASLVTEAWRIRTDRGAEDRLGLSPRGALYPREALRADPHREMHTRGG